MTAKNFYENSADHLILAQAGPGLSGGSANPTTNPSTNPTPTTNQNNTTETTQQAQQVTPDPDVGPGAGFIVFLIVFFLIVLGIAAGFLYIYRDVLRKKDREEKTRDGVLFEIRLPRDNEIEIGNAEQMFANLYSIGGQGKGLQKHITVNNAISFEIVGLPGDLRFYIYSPRKYAELVEKQVLGSYQDADIAIVEEHNIFHEDSQVAYASLEMTEEKYYPIKVAEDFSGDPVANILSAMGKMGENEGAFVQIVMSPAGSGWQKSGRKYVQKVEGNNADPEKTRMKVSQDQLEAISKKVAKPGFSVAIRVVSAAPDEAIAKMHVDNIVGAFDQFANPGINDFKKAKVRTMQEREMMENVIYRRMPLNAPNVLNVEELAGLYHFPNKDITTPNINWLLAKQAPAATWIHDAIDDKDSIWLGTNEYRGRVKDICFKRGDRRRHTYVIAQTGVGKSWLLLRMIMQDIYNGDGVCVLDPHGSLAEMVIERIPHERAEDVIYFNAADEERPFGFNLLDYHSEQDKHRVVNSFINLLKKLYDPQNQGIVGPILEQTVRNSMLTVMSLKGSSLIEVVRAITDHEWVKEKWIPVLKDELVKKFWVDQAFKMTEQTRSEQLGYITSKFDMFVTNLAVRNIIGQTESSFNFRDVMDNQKILIVNLSKGIIGAENASFLGLLMIPKILSAALSREDIPEDDRKDFYMYVDEFQNFASEEFTAILSEARKYRLCLTMAHQYIDQLTDDIKDAVFGNVGTLILGRVGPEDSEFLEKQVEPTILSNDILNQPNVHYYTKLIVDGKYPLPFSLNPFFYTKGHEFQAPKNKEVEELVRKLSKLKFGRDAEIVTAEINERADLTSSNDAVEAGPDTTLPPPLSLS